MKSPAEIARRIEQRLQDGWHLEAAGESASWPKDIPVGNISTRDLTADFPTTQRQVHVLRDWASKHGVAIRQVNRRVQGTSQPIPTHVTIPDLDSAAAICGGEWTARIDRGRERAAIVRDRYPDCLNVAAVVRAADGYSGLDFSLLLTVTDWFQSNTAEGLTPRQVPLPGVNAKWLNSGQPIVELLTGRPLNLLPRHPARIHLTYLDPDHLSAGGRRFDSATVGDTMRPAYEPKVVIITENKDTAVHFPTTAGGIAVEGGGAGGATAAQFDWLLHAPLIVYWGDIDADGFEILDGYRRDGVTAVSILMDNDTYRAYAAWGTFHYPDGREIPPRTPKVLPNLTEGEQSAYLSVCSPAPGLPPRIEQERIPLSVAHEAVTEAIERLR